MQDATFIKRTYYLGIANGTLFAVFSALTDPNTVTAALITTVVASPLAVGLAAGMTELGWAWPSLFVANRVESQPYRMPFYRKAALGRWLSMIAMAALVLLLGRRGALPLLVLFIAVLFIKESLGGVSILAFRDIVARHVPPTKRGSFLAWRSILGGLLGVACGLLVRFVLDADRSGLRFPTNFATLYFLGALFGGAGLALFSAVRESPGRAARRMSLRMQLGLGPRLVRRDPNYRRLLAVHACARAARSITPLLIPFAIIQLGVPQSAVGTYISISVGFGLVGVFLWGRVSDRRGNRLVLFAASLASITAPLLACSLRWVPDVPIHFAGAATLRQALFVLVFALAGVAMRGMMLGIGNYLLEIAPPRRRISYVGFLNLLGSALFALPVLAGALAQATSYYLIFGLAAVAAVAAASLAYSLEEPRNWPDRRLPEKQIEE